MDIKKDYRKIQALNQSAIITFSKDPVQFYKEYILNQGRSFRGTSATLIGDLTDFFLLECNASEMEFDQKFDEKFARIETVGKAQVYTLADELFEIAKRSAVDGVVQENFSAMFKEAFRTVRNAKCYQGEDEDKAYKKALEEFLKKGKPYYDSKLVAMDKSQVNDFQIQTAKRIANQMLTDNNISWIFRGDEDIEYLPKYAIEFEYMNFDCKMEADMIHINHSTKMIQPYDLKTTYDNESFENSYLFRAYYIQAGYYRLGIIEWAKTELPGYIVNPMKFVVGDTSMNARRPLVYETDWDMFEESMYGFTYKGEEYKGINTLMEEIKWAEETGIWTISKTNFDNKSTIKMKPYAEYNTKILE